MELDVKLLNFMKLYFQKLQFKNFWNLEWRRRKSPHDDMKILKHV